MSARVFLKTGSEPDFHLACEMEAADADDVWRMVESDPDRPGRRLRPGDIVYVGDLYLELDGDGGWRPVAPGSLTRRLHHLIA